MQYEDEHKRKHEHELVHVRFYGHVHDMYVTVFFFLNVFVHEYLRGR